MYKEVLADGFGRVASAFADCVPAKMVVKYLRKGGSLTVAVFAFQEGLEIATVVFSEYGSKFEVSFNSSERVWSFGKFSEAVAFARSYVAG